MSAKKLAFAAVFMLSAAWPAAAQVKIAQSAEQIAVEIDGKPFTVFYIGGKDLNRPYLHPIRAASGKIVNRSFPAGQVPGETIDHPHHAGLFYGHGDVNGFNYWAIQNVPPAASEAPNPMMGRIVLQRVVSVKSGTESGVVDTVFNWLKPDGWKWMVKLSIHPRTDKAVPLCVCGPTTTTRGWASRRAEVGWCAP